MHRLTFALVLWIACAQAAFAQTPRASEFRIVFDESVNTAPYTGRVYVALARNARIEPRLQLVNWVSPVQVLAIDVKDVPPGGSVTISSTDLAYPKAFSELEPGVYTVQAVIRRSLDCPHPGQGMGDAHSQAARIRLDRDDGLPFDLVINQAATELPFPPASNAHVFEMRSALLSTFHGRDITVRASITLPDEWHSQADRVWPTLVSIGGFGSDHREGIFTSQIIDRSLDGPRRFLVVSPDPSCGYGHCVFADSENNGPWGRMLVEELLPAIDKQFRGGGPATRHVAGVSSGGWASLWLVVNYPEHFAACWSHAPDPVDFRDFQRIDLYAPGANMYRDEKGDRRPLARNDSGVMLWYDDFVRRESVIGRGGQIGSFEAVFSPRGADGLPRPLFDRATGAVDPETAKAWEKYDIRLVIERGWEGADGKPGLGERLRGKINVFAGGKDNFYLEGAAEKLKAALARLGSDAVVEIDPAMNHTYSSTGRERMIEVLQVAGGAPPRKPKPETDGD